MDVKDLLKLVDAGFTPAQIEKLTGEPQAAPEEPAAPAEAQAEPAPVIPEDPAPVSDPIPAPAPAQTIQQASLEALQKELKDLRLALQAQNLRANGPAPKEETVEDVLASIIAP